MVRIADFCECTIPSGDTFSTVIHMPKTKATRKRAPIGPLTARKRSGLEAEQFAQRELVRAVMERRLKPGTKLDEDVLADVFNISRTRLRKVLSLLATHLIVTHKPNYGTFVAMPSASEARDVFEARQGIEDVIVRIIGEKRSNGDFAALRRLVAEEQRAYKLQKAGAIELSGDFHMILADLAGNSLLKTYVHQLVIRTILIQVLYGPQHLCLAHEHAEILEALERCDTRAAAKRMSHHLHSIEGSCVFREMDEEAVDLRSIFQHSREPPLSYKPGMMSR